MLLVLANTVHEIPLSVEYSQCKTEPVVPLNSKEPLLTPEQTVALDDNTPGTVTGVIVI